MEILVDSAVPLQHCFQLQWTFVLQHECLASQEFHAAHDIPRDIQALDLIMTCPTNTVNSEPICRWYEDPETDYPLTLITSRGIMQGVGKISKTRSSTAPASDAIVTESFPSWYHSHHVCFEIHSIKPEEVFPNMNFLPKTYPKKLWREMPLEINDYLRIPKGNTWDVFVVTPDNAKELRKLWFSSCVPCLAKQNVMCSLLDNNGRIQRIDNDVRLEEIVFPCVDASCLPEGGMLVLDTFVQGGMLRLWGAGKDRWIPKSPAAILAENWHVMEVSAINRVSQPFDLPTSSKSLISVYERRYFETLYDRAEAWSSSKVNVS